MKKLSEMEPKELEQYGFELTEKIVKFYHENIMHKFDGESIAFAFDNLSHLCLYSTSVLLVDLYMRSVNDENKLDDTEKFVEFCMASFQEKLEGGFSIVKAKLSEIKEAEQKAKVEHKEEEKSDEV